MEDTYNRLWNDFYSLLSHLRDLQEICGIEHPVIVLGARPERPPESNPVKDFDIQNVAPPVAMELRTLLVAADIKFNEINQPLGTSTFQLPLQDLTVEKLKTFFTGIDSRFVSLRAEKSYAQKEKPLVNPEDAARDIIAAMTRAMNGMDQKEKLALHKAIMTHMTEQHGAVFMRTLLQKVAEELADKTAGR